MRLSNLRKHPFKKTAATTKPGACKALFFIVCNKKSLYCNIWGGWISYADGGEKKNRRKGGTRKTNGHWSFDTFTVAVKNKVLVR